MVTGSILDIIGGTPMLSLNKLTGFNIFAKAEYLNPGGSIKDRIAKYMIEAGGGPWRFKTRNDNHGAHFG